MKTFILYFVLILPAYGWTVCETGHPETCTTGIEYYAEEPIERSYEDLITYYEEMAEYYEVLSALVEILWPDWGDNSWMND